MATILSVDNINKSFGKKSVLEDVSLHVNQGDVFGLIGLNGVGKTTLIKIILGLLDQEKGKVTIFDNDVTKTSTRKQISFLPEKFHPSIYLKGWEFLDINLSYYGRSYKRDECREEVKKLDLNPDALDQKITKYSKGMGQKLGLASSFLAAAPLLILDEPMSGLDPRARIYLKDRLLDYAKQKNTIFFSSHILSDIDEICNKIAVINDRKIIFTGTPSAFKKKYSEKHLERAFLKSIG